ncbi:MAG TPA: hypothetical protein VM328_11250, partial [Fimbriimonadaceae bacterium]|nr:hypothetical protein [Fimbriimonadaceae bacterium]
ELARVIVAPQAGMPEATSLLSRALQEASKRAKERGAKPARSGEVAELRNMQDVTAEQQAQRVISMVMGQSEQSVIIVYAFWNVFQDESVPVVANAYRNPLVYRAGQVITERRIDASRDEEDILRQVSAFISTDVRNKAIADKMIPAQGHEQSLGAVSPEMVFNLVADLKRLGRSVRLQALARNDTRAADPLQLDFRVR